MKVLLVGSAGGHLAQMLSLKDWWESEQRWWVTFDLPDAQAALAGEPVMWAQHSDKRRPWLLLRSVWLAWNALRLLRPDVVVSTGASLGAIFVVFARLLRIPTIYIEVFDRIEISSLSGRICYRIADRFCVQWKEQLKVYPKAEVVGPLL